MPSAVGSIMRSASRGDGPLNIVTFPTHERYETGLCKTGHRFWAVRTPQVKDWNGAYAPVPENYVLLNPAHTDRQLPPEVEFDLVLSQNKFGQFQLARQIATSLHLPLVSLEHTLPHVSWPAAQLKALKGMRGDVNVFISEYSRHAWDWSPEEACVIHHGVDTWVFSPDGSTPRKAHLLSVVNDWKNRDWCCGYSLWQEATAGLPVFVVGDTPGLSKPAASVAELVMRYQEAAVFVNTSTVSPVPTALLEAMACGAAVVSTANCMVPEIVKNGHNGFISNNAAEIGGYCRRLLGDAELCRKLGEEARKTIVERFSMGRFVSDWNRIFGLASQVIYTGA